MAAFTLVELFVAVALGLLALAAVGMLVLYTSRSFVAITNQDSRPSGMCQPSTTIGQSKPAPVASNDAPEAPTPGELPDLQELEPSPEAQQGLDRVNGAIDDIVESEGTLRQRIIGRLAPDGGAP